MKNFIAGFIIAAILGTAFGYWWAYKAYTRTYELRLEQKEIIINHYREFWTPIRQTPVVKRVK